MTCPIRFSRANLAGVSLIALATAAPAAAQDSSDPGEPARLNDIVVTAAGYEQRIAQAPASISVIPQSEIQELRATSIAEILTTVEGVDVGAAVGKSGGQTINIRGMGADYTLILIDGRRQNTAGSVTPNGFGETANSFMPPVSAIDRIEVVRGPVSTLYGSDAMGGVVNVITRKVGDAWGGSVSGNYTIQGDSDFGGLYGTDFYINGPIVADKMGLAVRGSWSAREASVLTFETVDGVETPVPGFGRSATENEIWSLGGRLSWTPNADHDLWLDADVGRQWYDNSAGQMGTNTAIGGYGDALEFKRDQLSLAHDWRMSLGVLESNLSYGRTETIGRIIPSGVRGAGGPRILESENRIFDTRLRSSWSNHNFIAGGQYWEAEMIDGVAPAAFDHMQWAIFGEDEIRFTDALALTLGARHDDHSKFGSHFSPRGYLVWNATPAWTFKGGVSQGFKTPQLEQLAEGINGFGRQGQLPLLGTPTLKPETSTSTEIAAFYDGGGGLRAGLTLFRNVFEDKIANGPDIANCAFGLTRAQYDAGDFGGDGCIDVGFWPSYATFGQKVNVDEAETQGLEAATRWRFADNWTLSANYTWTESEQKSGEAKGLPLTDTPEHMVNASLRWAASDRLDLWVRAEYRSERFRGLGEARDAWGDYAAYELLHLGGSYQVNDRVTMNATVYNLLDRDFVSLLPFGSPVAWTPQYANNQEPRRLWLSVRTDF